MRILTLLLPALIPSWRFFKTVAPSPRLELRRDGGWQRLPAPDLPMTLPALVKRLVWNPDWNAHLYSVTLAERLAETGDPRAQAGLRRYIASRTSIPEDQVQFRLLFTYREGEKTVTEELNRSAG